MNSIEAGDADPRASRIVAIAQELGVSTDALLLGTPATGSREHKPAATRRRTRQAAQVVSEGIMSTNAELYEQDFYAWTQTTAALIRAGKWYDLDPEALAEEIESLGKSQHRELGSRL